MFKNRREELDRIDFFNTFFIMNRPQSLSEPDHEWFDNMFREFKGWLLKGTPPTFTYRTPSEKGILQQQQKMKRTNWAILHIT